MIELLEKGIALANHYGISVLLILSTIFLVRIILAAQGKWSEREKYYFEILKNLGNWRDSLSDRKDYFQQPGSVYDETYPQSTYYKKEGEKAADALSAIREQMSVARVFLSKKSIAIIEELINEHWYISEHGAMNAADYLDSTHDIVDKAYRSILTDASRDLKRSRYLNIVKQVLSKD